MADKLDESGVYGKKEEYECYRPCAPSGGAEHFGGRLVGVTALEQACCQDHGFIPPTMQVLDVGGPYCPHCYKKIVAIRDCPVHGQILSKDIKWTDNKPYCPNCENSPLEEK